MILDSSQKCEWCGIWVGRTRHIVNLQSPLYTFRDRLCIACRDRLVDRLVEAREISIAEAEARSHLSGGTRR